MSDLMKHPTIGSYSCYMRSTYISIFIIIILFISRCVLEYGKDDNGKLTNTLSLRRMGTTLVELQKEFGEEQPAYALFRVVSYEMNICILCI